MTRPSNYKSALAGAYAFAACGLIACAFWHQDWRYRAPTPLPAGRVVAARRDVLAARVMEAAGLAASARPQPLFLHFFNPQCPCSRFNLDHVRKLIRAYGAHVRFVAVLQGDDDESALRESWRKLQVNAECAIDDDGRIAAACGVYATPQAVLLDADGELYFRGNYNTTRYCDDPRTQYARLALEALRAGQSTFATAPDSAVAYGCALPSDERLATAANTRAGRP